LEILRFRIRVEDKIVGYRRALATGNFYSKDEYAWSGNQIEGLIEDPCLDLKDKNQRFIYAEDILEMKSEGSTLNAYLTFDSILKEFMLLSVDGEELLSSNPLTYLQSKTIHRFAYGFRQKLS
jgi:hypothetical protein